MELNIAALALTTALAATPAMSPDRGHAWQETAAEAIAVEQRHADSTLEDELSLQSEPNPQYLRFALAEDSPFEMMAFIFKEGLAQIMYPIHLPVRDAEATKSLDAVPAEFFAVRDWLTQQYGEPRAFTGPTGHDVDFTDANALLDITDYRFMYTWCSDSASAFLSAQRDDGDAPVVIASVESPHLPADPKDVAMGHGCVKNEMQ